jgi:hypothetical protein
MGETLALRPISRAAVPEALKKAEHYRLLNDPEQAESICLDVIEVDPDNQQALVVIILAISDHFGSGRRPMSEVPVSEYLARLTNEYQRSYYTGIVRERRARAQLRHTPAKHFAYDGLREAMEYYEKAASIRALDNDEAVLRWNSCVRTIRQANLEPRPKEPELPLE